MPFRSKQQAKLMFAAAASPKVSPNQKAAAKRFAKSTGTKYPSLLANMRGAQAKK